jgi:hypothetical protein
MNLNFRNNFKISQGTLYIVISLFFWLLAEFVTVWHTKIGEWISLMPFALIQYIVIIVIFWYFLFKKRWDEKRVFVIMLVIMFALEIIWKNYLLLNIYWSIPASLLLISIWGFLTFIPFWIVKRSLNSHKIATGYYLLWIPLGFTISLIL